MLMFPNLGGIIETKKMKSSICYIDLNQLIKTQMKTIVQILGMCMMLLICNAMFSQLTVAESNFLLSQPVNVILDEDSSNSVFINQMGDGNTITSKTFSESSEINYFQIGNNNEIIVNLRSTRIEENILQFGNDNSVINMNRGDQIFHKGEIMQNGNNQSLVWLGDNGISEKLEVTMIGDSKMIIVNNFN